MTPCSLVCGYWCFGGTCCLYFPTHHSHWSQLANALNPPPHARSQWHFPCSLLLQQPVPQTLHFNPKGRNITCLWNSDIFLQNYTMLQHRRQKSEWSFYFCGKCETQMIVVLLATRFIIVSEHLKMAANWVHKCVFSNTHRAICHNVPVLTMNSYGRVS
jgi:hypothetical protein